MNAKHTPGPWFVSTADGSGDSLYVGSMVVQSPRTAFAGRASTHEILRAIDRETLYANAVLMAQAPRMVSALQRAAHVLAELPTSEQTPQMLALRTEIVETIKQATPDYYGSAA